MKGKNMSLTVGEVKRRLRQRAPGWRMAVVAVAVGASAVVFYRLVWSATEGVRVEKFFTWRANGGNQGPGVPDDSEPVELAAFISGQALGKLYKALELVTRTQVRYDDIGEWLARFMSRARVHVLRWGDWSEVEAIEE